MREMLKRKYRPVPRLTAVMFCVMLFLTVLFFGMTARAETGHISGAASWKKAASSSRSSLSMENDLLTQSYELNSSVPTEDTRTDFMSR